MTTRTFLDAPACPPDADAIRAAGARAAFLGAPIDTGVVPWRPGTALGPEACRRASAQFAGNPLYDSRVEVRSRWRLVDCGDATLGVADGRRHQDAVRAALQELLAGGALPILFGGDHSIPIPGLEALCAAVPGRIGYLQLDAHLDTADSVDGDRWTMASPAARAIERPQVGAANVAVVGVRGAANSFEEIAAAEAHGIHVFPMEDCVARGAEAVIEDALDVVWAGADAVYVSLDNDALDAGCAPGTTAPEPGGFTARELAVLARAAGRRGVALIDVAELSPPYDVAGVTARLDCYWILRVLAAYAVALASGQAAPPPYAVAGEGA